MPRLVLVPANGPPQLWPITPRATLAPLKQPGLNFRPFGIDYSASGCQTEPGVSTSTRSRLNPRLTHTLHARKGLNACSQHISAPTAPRLLLQLSCPCKQVQLCSPILSYPILSDSGNCWTRWASVHQIVCSGALTIHETCQCQLQLVIVSEWAKENSWSDWSTHKFTSRSSCKLKRTKAGDPISTSNACLDCRIHHFKCKCGLKSTALKMHAWIADYST
eukprot:514796-Pelagomonas_calceolata.AAC.1